MKMAPPLKLVLIVRINAYRADSREHTAEIQMIAEAYMITDGLFDDTTRTARLNSQRRHPLSGFATECDGLGDSPFVRTIGNASHLAPRLHGRVVDKSQAQASIAVALCGSVSKRPLRLFKKSFALRLRQTNDQTGKTG
jgi:hypothetical protein